jgi:hypothetical protein
LPSDEHADASVATAIMHEARTMVMRQRFELA